MTDTTASREMLRKNSEELPVTCSGRTRAAGGRVQQGAHMDSYADCARVHSAAHSTLPRLVATQQPQGATAQHRHMPATTAQHGDTQSQRPCHSAHRDLPGGHTSHVVPGWRPPSLHHLHLHCLLLQLPRDLQQQRAALALVVAAHAAGCRGQLALSQLSLVELQRRDGADELRSVGQARVGSGVRGGGGGDCLLSW